MLHFKLKTRWCFTQTVLMKSPRRDNYLTPDHHSHLAEIQLCKILSDPKKMFVWNTILSWLHLGQATTSQWKCNMFCPRWNMKFLRHSTRIGPKGAKLSTMHTAWRQALPLESQPLFTVYCLQTFHPSFRLADLRVMIACEHNNQNDNFKTLT